MGYICVSNWIGQILTIIIRNNIKATFLFSIAGFKFHGSMVFRENYKSNHRRRCSVEKVFLKISQNSQENTCTRITLLKKHSTAVKKLWQRCFPVNFEKKIKYTFFTGHLRANISENIKINPFYQASFLVKQ